MQKVCKDFEKIDMQELENTCAEQQEARAQHIEKVREVLSKL